MAIEPAAISAAPPTTMSRVELTAPDRPAASAKGTVSPSDMPMTTSRTKSPAVKCFSTCGVSGIVCSNLRMGFEIEPGLAYHLAFSAVGELAERLGQRKPQGTPDFHPHFGSDLVDAAGLVTQKIEADDFEDTLPVSPGAHIDVADVGEFGDQAGNNAGLLAHLAQGGLVGLFIFIDQALGQRE